jgi:hypothetical protein
MARIGRTREIGSMTVDTICREACVLSIFVAVFACDCAMCSCEREFRRPMVKRGRQPDSSRMTSLTLVTETRKGVRRTRGLGIVRLMTLIAVRVGELVVAINVARLARCGEVRPRECKPGRPVIECRGEPTDGRMARLTPVIQESNDVIGIRRLPIVGLVAREAICVLQCIVVVHVAQLTLSNRVLAGQREIRAVVVEGGRFPSRCRMALRTDLRIAHGEVIWSSHIRIICAVAVNAI